MNDLVSKYCWMGISADRDGMIEIQARNTRENICTFRIINNQHTVSHWYRMCSFGTTYRLSLSHTCMRNARWFINSMWSADPNCLNQAQRAQLYQDIMNMPTVDRFSRPEGLRDELAWHAQKTVPHCRVGRRRRSTGSAEKKISETVTA